MRTPRTPAPKNFPAFNSSLIPRLEAISPTLETEPRPETVPLVPMLPGARRSSPLTRAPVLKIAILGPAAAEICCPDYSRMFHGLVRELSARGHDVLFLERVSEFPGKNRDSLDADSSRVGFYSNLKDLKERHTDFIRGADLVVVGSGLRENSSISEWVTRTAQGATAFYDFDTAATIGQLLKGKAAFITAALIPRFQLYLSFTGGPILGYLEKHYGAAMARPLYASVDSTLYFPEERRHKWDLGYLGLCDSEHLPGIEQLLLEPARRWKDGRFVLAGAKCPRELRRPRNVKQAGEIEAGKLRAFFNSQRYALNLTPRNQLSTVFAPSTRLFQAAACGTPVISDSWPGVETFFKPDEEILVSNSSDETLVYLEEIPEIDRRRIGYRARERVLARHTIRHRAKELETYALEILQLAAA